MEGQDIFTQILSAIESHQISVIVALSLVILVGFARDVASRVNLSGFPKKILSVLAAYASGVSGILMTGIEWWKAMILACATPVASQGFRDIVVDIVKLLKKKK